MDKNLKWFFEPEKIQRTPYKGEIGNLERMLDELIGYIPPQDITSKKGAERAYGERMGLIQQAKEQAPPEVVQQIEKLEKQLDNLREAKNTMIRIEEGIKEAEKNNTRPEIIKFVKVSGSKMKLEQKQEFLDRMAKREVVVNKNGKSLQIDKFLEKDSKVKPFTPIIEESEKVEVFPENPESGILSPETVFETDLWFLRNHAGFDLSVRNGRRLRH